MDGRADGRADERADRPCAYMGIHTVSLYSLRTPSSSLLRNYCPNPSLTGHHQGKKPRLLSCIPCIWPRRSERARDSHAGICSFSVRRD